MNLTAKQQLIINKFNNNENVFITGAAGCGKSFIVSYLINLCKEKCLKYSVTATTGTAL